MKLKISKERDKSSLYKEKYFEIHRKLLKAKAELDTLAGKGVEIDVNDKISILKNVG